MISHKLAKQMMLQKDLDEYLGMIDSLVLMNWFVLNEFRFYDRLIIQLEDDRFEVIYISQDDRYEVQFVPVLQDSKQMEIHKFRTEDEVFSYLTRAVRDYLEDVINPDTYLALKDVTKKYRDYGYTLHFNKDKQVIHASKIKSKGRVDFIISKRGIHQTVEFNDIKDVDLVLDSSDSLFKMIPDDDVDK